MTNYSIFEKECTDAFNNREIDKLDMELLLKIAKAITEEDSSIKMHLKPFGYSNRHCIECDGKVEDFRTKIEKAVESAYVYYQNVSFWFNTCTIDIPTSQFSQGVKKIIDEQSEKAIRKQIAERVKPSCQFAELVDWIVKLAEKGKYDKCDGVIEDFIRNYDCSQLRTEEEVLDDYKKVINGTIDDEESDTYIYTDEVHQIAEKYHTNVSNIDSTLEVKIRCFDRDYIYRSGFFDLNPQDHEIIKRKLQGKPFDDVEEFKLLCDIDLNQL